MTLHLSGIPKCLPLFLLPLLVYGATNVTVDDQDPKIVYTPQRNWQTVDGLDVDLGGTHMVTSDVDGYAEIKMTFISFYIVSALYPIPIMADITLDGGLPARIDFRDDISPKFNSNVTEDVTAIHGTVPHKIVFAHYGNSSQEHVVRLSSGGDSGLVLDAFIFEVDSVPPSENSSASNNHTKLIAIGLGVAIPVLLLVILVALLLLRRRRKSKKAIVFDPNAMGGRPATRQDIRDDVFVANGDGSGMVASPLPSNSLAVETPPLIPRTKTPEADSPLMAALLSERNIDMAGTSPMASTIILSTSPDSSTSLIGHHSRSFPHSTVPLRSLSPVHHPSLQAQIQSRRQNSITGAGLEEVGTRATNRHGHGGQQPLRQL